MAEKPLIRYVQRDYDSFLQSMLDQIPLKTPEWTTYNMPSDMGRVLLELFAYAFDVLAYYQDVLVNEAFLDTATQRKSIINLCKLIGYTLRPAKPAKVLLTFTFVPQPNPVNIPKGFQVATVPAEGEQEIIFETIEPAVLPPGQSEITVEAEEGRTVSRELLGVSTQTPDQSFQLKQSPVIFDSIQITVDDGTGEVEWTRVDSFLDSQPGDHHYTASLDENDRATITFGNDINGRIPPLGAKIYAYYRIGGGAYGNVSAGKLTKPKSTLPGLISVTNHTPATGGQDKESIEEARKNAPASLRAASRAVTAQDFKALAETVKGVARAHVLPTTKWGYPAVKVIIVPEEGEIAPPELKQAVQSFLDDHKLLTTIVTIEDPTYVRVYVEVVVQVKDYYTQSSVRASVQQVLETLLASNNRDFGQPLYQAEIIDAIMGVDGVKNVRLVYPTQDVMVGPNEILKVTNINLTMEGGIPL